MVWEVSLKLISDYIQWSQKWFSILKLTPIQIPMTSLQSLKTPTILQRTQHEPQMVISTFIKLNVKYYLSRIKRNWTRSWRLKDGRNFETRVSDLVNFQVSTWQKILLNTKCFGLRLENWESVKGCQSKNVMWPKLHHFLVLKLSMCSFIWCHYYIAKLQTLLCLGPPLLHLLRPNSPSTKHKTSNLPQSVQQ